MHRHSYKGRKFGRETGERKALVRTLTISLIKSQSITTTLARAKEIRRGTERLITRAKKGGLANRRIIIARLNNIEAADYLIDVIAPQITRDSGYLRIEREGFRKGDHTELGTISFVDDIDPDFGQQKAEKTTEKKETK